MGADVYCAICGGPLSVPWWEVGEAPEAGQNEDDNRQSQDENIKQMEIDASETSDQDEKDEEEQEERVETGMHDEANEQGENDENDDNGEPEVEALEENESKYQYDPAIIKPDSEAMNWLRDARIICENPDSSNLLKVYITGTATHEDLNMFNVEPSDDQSFPASANRFFNVYSWEADTPIAVPFHQHCRQLLGKAVGVQELDKELLYATFKSLAHPGEYENSLAIDYGALNDFHEQYWVVERGYEYVLFSPVNIPELQAYCEALPRLQDTPAVQNIDFSRKSRNETDPFFRLEPETMLMILNSLDVASLFRLRQASTAMCNLDLPQSFWRRRLQADMPWIYELSNIPDLTPFTSVNWAQAYKGLQLASRDKVGGVERIQGLANRRRIWQTPLSQIARHYLTLRTKMNAGTGREAIVLQGATATTEPRLVFPDPKETQVVAQTFIDSSADLSTARCALVFRWNEDRGLADIQVNQHELDLNLALDDTDVVRFPESDWITGLIVTSKEKERRKKEDERVRRIIGVAVLFNRCESIKIGHQVGDKRLIHVSEGNFAVGIRTHVSSDDRISKIAILQKPHNTVYNVERIVPQPVNSFNPEISHYLWHNELPPPTLRATDHEVGYWNHDLQTDISPMEALIFGTTEEELADVTCISADVGFGGFQVTYMGRPTRSIGPRLKGLKALEVNGRGGERIVRIYHATEHIPVFLRFVTNWGRQLVIGHHEGQDEVWPPASLEHGNENTVAGFYGWWPDRQLLSTTLGAVGCLYQSNPAEQPADYSFPNLKDANGLNWKPEAPPTSIEEYGKIWAEREEPRQPLQRAIVVPGLTSVVSWLDCSLPLSAIEATFCHRLNRPQIPLCRITFKYASNGEEATVGAKIFPTAPSEGSDMSGKEWCWCELGYQGENEKSELTSKPHYTHETYLVDGKRLTSLLIWLSDVGSLVALQFKHEGGEAPVWSAEPGDIGEPSGEIRFTGPGGGDAVGVKVFFQDSHRSVTREDSVVVAIQALRKVEGETE